jgi:predicted amidohydrolase YtcJ
MMTRSTACLPRSFSLAIAVAVLAPTPFGGQETPGLVLAGGRIFTGDPSRPWVEALAIAGDRIQAVGTSADIRARVGATTRVIDLGGGLVVPGFNDAHTHPGAMPEAVRLEGPPAMEHDPTLDEVGQRLKAAVGRTPARRWIFGEIGSAVLDDPAATRFALDRIAPDHFVMLWAWTGHGTLLNTAALKRLGVADEEPDPAGGFYRRMPGGKTVSGIAHEYAEYRLRQRVALEAPAQAHRDAFSRFAAEAAALGVTSIQAMMTDMPARQAAQVLAETDLPVRTRLIDFPLSDPKKWQALPARAAGSSRVTVSGTKWILDGTPIERLMFLRDPYADRELRGRLNYSADDLRQFLDAARAAGEQPMVHAVGDAAIDALLDGLEASGGDAWRPLRPRLEHGDLLQPDQFDRARRFGVVLVQNPSHFMIGPIMEARLGAARRARVHAIKSSVAAGVPLALGSDGPLNPFLNLMFAVTPAVNPREAVTLEQAVVAYTQGSAFAEMQERNKGTLAPGMWADLAVLSQDIFKIRVDALPKTTSVLTIVAGRIVHETK